mgnify:CR=1 FL=1
MYSIYIWIDGDQFDADEFQRNLSPGLIGSVQSRKRFTSGVVEHFGKYWESEVKDSIFDHPEEELVNLFVRYKHELLRARAEKASRIVGEIVATYRNLDEARGFYLSHEMIQLLAQLSASIDIDIVRDLEGI